MSLLLALQGPPVDITGTISATATHVTAALVGSEQFSGAVVAIATHAQAAIVAEVTGVTPAPPAVGGRSTRHHFRRPRLQPITAVVNAVAHHVRAKARGWYQEVPPWHDLPLLLEGELEDDELVALTVADAWLT